MAIGNLDKFQRQLNYFSENEIPQTLMRRQIEISLHLLNKLQRRTPVDTGFAISNWRMNVDYIPNGTLGTYQKALAKKMKHNLASTAKDRALGRMTSAKAKILSAPTVVHDRGKFQPLQSRSRDTLIATAFEHGQNYNTTQWKKIGHVIYVFNNVNYMQVLANGHSTQAPKGWIPLCVAETKAWMQTKGW
jgi:hypothetical protein